MPFSSESQRRYLWANHPDIAQRWVYEGSKSTGLPKKSRHSRTSKRGKRRGRRH